MESFYTSALDKQYWHSFGAMHVFSVWPTSPTSWPTQVKSVRLGLQLHFVRIITLICICFCNSINCEDFKIFLWVYLPWSRTPKKLLIAKDLKLKFECSYTVGLHVAKWFFFFQYVFNNVDSHSLLWNYNPFWQFLSFCELLHFNLKYDNCEDNY